MLKCSGSSGRGVTCFVQASGGKHGRCLHGRLVASVHTGSNRRHSTGSSCRGAASAIVAACHDFHLITTAASDESTRCVRKTAERQHRAHSCCSDDSTCIKHGRKNGADYHGACPHLSKGRADRQLVADLVCSCHSYGDRRRYCHFRSHGGGSNGGGRHAVVCSNRCAIDVRSDQAYHVHRWTQPRSALETKREQGGSRDSTDRSRKIGRGRCKGCKDEWLSHLLERGCTAEFVAHHDRLWSVQHKRCGSALNPALVFGSKIHDDPANSSGRAVAPLRC